MVYQHRSILDNDLYKLSMQQGVLELYPDVEAEYVFVNRRAGKDEFNADFCNQLQTAINGMADLRLTDQEYKYVRSIPWFKPSYVEYLRNYRFNPDHVKIECVNVSGQAANLSLRIKGPWRDTIWDEVPLMAAISEIWFANRADQWNMDGQAFKASEKARLLLEAGCNWTDFGTRRRRSFEVQELFVHTALNTQAAKPWAGKFIGTSNVLLAMMMNTTPIGTMAHEWIQAHSVLSSLRHANRGALEAWVKVYRSELGIALTDTYTTPAFFADFDPYLARLFDGVRHDSGCPFKFTDAVVAHYQKLKIDPSSKTIIFSDSLNVDLAIKIAAYCKQKGIRCSFGIGTHFTNDFEGILKALNMVIKLVKLDGVDVVKLSDDIKKAIGHPDAIRVARYVHCGIPLDAPMDTPFIAL